MAEDISFTKLLADYGKSKVAGQDEPSNSDEETNETEASAPETSKEASTEESTKLAGLDWLKSNSPSIEKYASEISEVMDNDENRELFGRCLDAVTLLKVGGYLAEDQTESAKDVVILANELYRRLP